MKHLLAVTPVSQWVSDSFRCDVFASPSFASLFWYCLLVVDHQAGIIMNQLWWYSMASLWSKWATSHLVPHWASSQGSLPFVKIQLQLLMVSVMKLTVLKQFQFQVSVRKLTVVEIDHGWDRYIYIDKIDRGWNAGSKVFRSEAQFTKVTNCKCKRCSFLQTWMSNLI